MEEQKVWKPFPRQEQFIRLPDDIFEGLFGGAAGPGKSEVLVTLPLCRGFINYPRFKGIILRRTFPELEREIIPRTESYYGAASGRYNSQDKVWKFPSGARIYLGHCENESDVRKYDTAEFNYVAFDELTSFSEFQYKYITIERCRSSQSGLPAIARSATNPGNVGHAWVRDWFKTLDVPSGTIIKDKKSGSLRIFIQAFLEDNPVLMKNDPGYFTRLEMLPEAEKRAKKYGDWNAFEGQVFTDWREFPLSDEPRNACHVVKPFNIPDWWPRILAIDWGSSAMMYALWGAISPDRRLYLYREYHCNGPSVNASERKKISQWAVEVKDLCKNEYINDFVICRSAAQDRGDEKTIQQQVADYIGRTPRLADNARVSGKVLIQEYLRWTQLPKFKDLPGAFDKEYAAHVLRNQGYEAYNDYLASFEEQPDEDNIPKLQVFDTLAVLRKTIPLCIYDDKNKEDVKEFSGDDPYDTLRYMCKAAEQYKDTSHREYAKREVIGKIIEQQEQKPDWNRFYMQMRMAEQSIKTRKVYRIHR